MEAEAEVKRRAEETATIKEANHQGVLLLVVKDHQVPLPQDHNLGATKTKRDPDRLLRMMFLHNQIQILNELLKLFYL